MLSFWSRLLRDRTSDAPPSGPSPTGDAAPEYPAGFLAAGGRPGDEAVIFDPALKHFPRAFSVGDPVFPDAGSEREWRDARRRVAAHLLRKVVGSSWNPHLVLRGSLLLRAWLGETAREPRDIDWVIRPSSVEADAPDARRLIRDVVQMAAESPRLGDVEIETDRVSVDGIWTYERAAGRRIVFPWKADGLPGGHVQMDFVFGEELPADPVQTLFPLYEGKPLLAWTASHELSLAWKLLWLETDDYPQGKDLYDAALLAEQTPPSRDLFVRVLRAAGAVPVGGLAPDFPMRWDVDWDNFRREYPWVTGAAADWQSRLTTALAPTFR